MISMGVCPENNPATARFEKKMKNTHQGKGGGTGNHSFNMQLIKILKHRCYLNRNVKIP